MRCYSFLYPKGISVGHLATARTAKEYLA